MSPIPVILLKNPLLTPGDLNFDLIKTIIELSVELTKIVSEKLTS